MHDREFSTHGRQATYQPIGEQVLARPAEDTSNELFEVLEQWNALLTSREDDPEDA